MNFYGTTTAANLTESPPVNLATIKRLMADFDASYPPESRPPEIYVMEDDCYNALKSQSDAAPGIHLPPGQSGSVYGVPVEHYPTEAACIARAAQLFLQRKLRVALVTMGE